MTRTYDVIGLGNALLDSLVTADDRVVESLGFERGIMHVVDHDPWMDAYGRFPVDEVSLQTGGSAANTIAALGLMGGAARFRGHVGRDEMGALYANQMAQACGGHAISTGNEDATGKCLSLVSKTDAERTMLTHLGAAPQMPNLGALAQLIPDAQVLHVTGYAFLGGAIKQVATEALALAKASGTRVSIDVADPFVVATLKDEMWGLLDTYADIVFMNAEEARAVCDSAAAEEALEILSRTVPTIVVKLGGKGSRVRHEGVTTDIEIERVEAVDTTGAGDSYASGFLYGVTRGWSGAQAGALGSRVAALTVSQMGAVVRDADALQDAVRAVETAG
jgi:sugar/nucleoside kinase (ribokinase family)